MSDGTPAWMLAAGDQLDAALERYKSGLFEQYLEGPGEASETPLRLWQENGVWCAVLAGPTTALCGYARLPDGHPWIGLHYADDIPDPPGLDRDQPVEQALDDHGAIPLLTAASLDAYERSLQAAVPVHGGVTWTGPMPIDGAPHGWWIGFDCAHAGDGIDEASWREQHPWASAEQAALLCQDGHVWTEDEVALEIKRMVPPILQAQQAHQARRARIRTEERD